MPKHNAFVRGTEVKARRQLCERKETLWWKTGLGNRNRKERVLCHQAGETIRDWSYFCFWRTQRDQVPTSSPFGRLQQGPAATYRIKPFSPRWSHFWGTFLGRVTRRLLLFLFHGGIKTNNSDRSRRGLFAEEGPVSSRDYKQQVLAGFNRRFPDLASPWVHLLSFPKPWSLGLTPINLDEMDLQPRSTVTGMWTPPNAVYLDPAVGTIQRKSLEIWVSNPRTVKLEGMSPLPRQWESA